MRIVGKDLLPPATNEPTAANLVAADRFMAGLRLLCGGQRHFFPKGVHRYYTHEEADAALLDAVARDMVELMVEREREA